jgi:DNA-binding PadR family transcriptional regulator
MFALLLALLDGQRHGYALMADVAGLTSGAISLGPGTLYRSLQRMRVDGLVEEIDQEPGPDDDRRAERRRSYRITDAGRAAAAEEATRLARLVAAAATRGLISGPISGPVKGGR